MYLTPTTAQPQVPVLSNPTNEQRHRMLFNSLAQAGRTIDYDNIVSLLSPAKDITRFGNPGEFKNLKVAILGGGLAGMTAAFELRKLGYDITIFEPITNRIGGRVYTYYFNEDRRYYGELGAMRIPVSHETTWHYINLFRLDTERIIQSDPNTFIYAKTTRIRNNPKNVFKYIYPQFNLTAQERNTPWPQLYNNVSKYYLSILPPEIRKQFLMALPGCDYRIEYLENMSLCRALENYGLSKDAINLIGRVMPINGALMFHSYETTISHEYSMDFVNLYRISGGMVNLPLAFYKSLISQYPAEYKDIPQGALGNIKWRGGYLVTGFSTTENGRSVNLTWKVVNDSNYRKENFDYVICSVPFPVLRGMSIIPEFSNSKMNAIKEVYYEDAQKTLFFCKEHFWEKQGIRGGSSYTDEIIQIVQYPDDHAYCKPNDINCSPDEPGVLLASYNIGEDAYALGNIVPNEQYEMIRSKVERLHGLPQGYLNNIVMDRKTVDWVSEPWFYGAFQMFLPGQKKIFYMFLRLQSTITGYFLQENTHQQKMAGCRVHFRVE